MSGINFGEFVESGFCVRDQILLLCTHSKQRLWKDRNKLKAGRFIKLRNGGPITPDIKNINRFMNKLHSDLITCNAELDGDFHRLIRHSSC